MSARLDDALVGAYLDRLRVDREEPSADALGRLHRAHVERIAYETLWIHMGDTDRRRWGTNPLESVRRIVDEQRGGYCFQLNGAFHLLLVALGYDCTRHVGTVHGPDGPTPSERANHLALTVRVGDSPTDASSSFYVDAGLGDALHEPLPLTPSAYRQEPMAFDLQRLDASTWALRHDPHRGSFTGMVFSTESAEMDSFDDQHTYLSTSPVSPFVRTLTVQRRDERGVDVLRGLVLRRVDDSPSQRTLMSESELFAVLDEVFDLPLTHVSADAKRELWTKLEHDHRTWEAARTKG
jgi:N-hydroxyarylamine O-acetyltransferase